MPRVTADPWRAILERLPELDDQQLQALVKGCSDELTHRDLHRRRLEDVRRPARDDDYGQAAADA